MSNKSNCHTGLKFLALLLLLVSVGVGIEFCIKPVKEPSDDGMSLTEWLQKYIDVDGRDAGFPSVETNNMECRKAIRLMNTNAIPFFLEWIRSEDSPIVKRGIGLVNKLLPAKRHLLLSTDMNRLGVLGFRLIGNDGQCAIPALIDLTTNNNPRVRFYALRCLWDIEANDKIFIPVIKRCESDPDERVQQYANALIIGIQFRPKPEGGSFGASTNALNSERRP